MTSALSDLLINRIKKTGPISVAEFMVEALHHKNIGYYTNSDPFGVAGDFTTAPEISQIFGELIGLWVLNAYRNQAKDDPLCLVELGPGRGTLMSDMVRAISNFANLEKMVELHLVETNPILRKVQDQLLVNLKPTWHNDLSTLPDQPWFLIANEFLATLPVHQLIKNKNRWNERLIDYNSADKCFTWTSTQSPSQLSLLIPEEISAKATKDALIEFSPATLGVIKIIADNIARKGGAALLIDYGYVEPIFKPSIQAVRAHKIIDPLSNPGISDLSCHVDFQSITNEAQYHEIDFHGPITQGEFLTNMGINERAESLKRGSTIQQSKDIDTAVKRLTDRKEMGQLFKIIGLTAKDSPLPPGFTN